MCSQLLDRADGHVDVDVAERPENTMMADESRIMALLEQILDTDCTPEEACQECPDLLPIVRDRLDRFRTIEAEVAATFPPRDESSNYSRAALDAASRPLPNIPGYDVEGIVGSGGMGVVYKARQQNLNRVVAIKMLLAGGYAGPHELDRFKREGHAIAALRHPNIVQVYDAGCTDGFPYFTMEFMDGGRLAEKLAGAPQPARDAGETVATLARAVHAAHQHSIVHRDLKPGNVLLTADGILKIADFGLARRLDTAEAATLTIPAARVGTPSYMSPEQARGSPGAVGPAVDIYALGAILYEMLTGRPPFRGESPADTERQVVADEPVPPKRLNTTVPRDLETICLKCLEKEPAHRYVTAAALADDLDRFARGEPIAARPVSRFGRLARWVRRKPASAALILAAIALVGLAIKISADHWRLESRRRIAIAEWTPTLEIIERFERAGRFQDARELLQRLPDTDIGVLSDRINAALGDLKLTQKMDAIRFNRTAIVDGRFDLDANGRRSDREYETAFAGGNIGGFNDAPSLVAGRIRASPIRSAFVSALDDWAVCTDEEHRRSWILEVARLADPDPSGWRDRVRETTPSPETLITLSATAVVQDQSVQLLVALSQRLQAVGADPIAFLVRVQRQYPGDFWASYTLAEALWGKKPAECIRFYQAALAIRPNTAVAHYNVGRALANVSQLYEAIEHFREAVRLEPKFGRAVSYLGVALYDTGQKREALDLVQKGIVLDPTTPRNYSILADVLRAEGRFEEAIDAVRPAIKLDPTFEIGRLGLALNLIQLGRLDEAKEQYQQAQRIDPNSGLPHYGMGMLLKRQGRIDEAISEFQTAARLSDELVEARVALGDCWREKQEHQKALFEYDKAVALQYSTGAGQSRRAMLVILGVGEQALAEWEQTIRAGPQNHGEWYGYAELCLYLGHQTEYARACREMLDRFESSGDPQVCERVGRSCLLGSLAPKDIARAAAIIERAIHASTTPEWTLPYLRVAQGLARYRLGDFAGAVLAMQGKASEVLGPLPHLVLAMAHLRAGRSDEAFLSFATALSIYDWRPSQADGQDAWICHALRREAEAMVMPNLPAMLAGQAKLRSPAERLALAAVCRSMGRTARAASLCAEAFEAGPDLADQPGADYRYYAACWAARAGCGDGEDAAGLSDKERASWRDQARQWLRDDLIAKKALLVGAHGEELLAISGKVQNWLKESELRGVRDEIELRKLRPVEREAWLELWRDTNALLAESRAAIGENPH
jgi:tetratricopeptide (TPR) repeat protein